LETAAWDAKETLCFPSSRKDRHECPEKNREKKGRLATRAHGSKLLRGETQVIFWNRGTESIGSEEGEESGQWLKGGKGGIGTIRRLVQKVSNLSPKSSSHSVSERRMSRTRDKKQKCPWSGELGQILELTPSSSNLHLQSRLRDPHIQTLRKKGQ